MGRFSVRDARLNEAHETMSRIGAACQFSLVV